MLPTECSMELGPERKRYCARSGMLADDDRLSALPDDILRHIMSFMKARQVVQTCVLSKKWKVFWRSVRCLDIDQEEFKDAGSNYAPDQEQEKFEDFTDHLLIPNKISIAELDTFRLHVTDISRLGKQAAKWIHHGIKFSTHKVPIPGAEDKEVIATYWHLKRLHLSNVYLDDRFTKHVSSSCPNLESLEMEDCSCKFQDIISHKLKSLILRHCSSAFSEINSSSLQSLVIDNSARISGPPMIVTAPALAYLLLSLNSDRFGIGGGVSFNPMPSLVKASFDLRCNDSRTKVSQNQMEVLCSLSNVTSLELLRFPKMLISEVSKTFPKFRDLRSLSLEQCNNFKILEQFLKYSPHLEKITLRFCKFTSGIRRRNPVDAESEVLKLTEIIYRNEDFNHVAKLMTGITGKLKKSRKLIKVD